MITPTPAPTAPPGTPAEQLAQNIATYQQLAEDLSVTISQIEVIQRQIDGLSQLLAAQRAKTGRIAAAAYQQERSGTLNAVLTAPSNEVALQRLLLLTGVALIHQEEMDRLGQETARYEAVQRTLEALRQQQRSQQQALIAQRIKIDQLRQPRR
ncbi:hypothetical protein [Catelliglobosispora koreensis]|uniref:hypothetical protein n=1 Tax=Catelliglobosispora koreensis TaxID=129052 RepID=UPI00037A9A35|nr:hypothetical protein [Catelliglobosispora koreensis]